MKYRKILRTVSSFLLMNVGVFITSLGLALFLIPSRVVAGGVSGISTVLYYSAGISIGMSMFFMNIILLGVQAWLIGTKSSLRTIYVILVQPALIEFLLKFFGYNSVTEDRMLACLFGGVLCGIGLGIVFRTGGTTGGTDIIAQLISKYLRFPVGVSLTFVDFSIALSAGLFLGKMELALYGIVAIFFTARIIDAVQQGFAYSKVVYIISPLYAVLSERIMDEMGRGVTGVSVKGMYTSEEKHMLMVIINQRELYKLMTIVKVVDPCCFLFVSPAGEVVGTGFREMSQSCL